MKKMSKMFWKRWSEAHQENVSSFLLVMAWSVFAFTYWILLLDFSTQIQAGDEGYALVNAWRIFEGQTPGRDFFEGIPPFSFVLTAVAFKVFGTTYLTARILTMVYAAILVLCVDRILIVYGATKMTRLASAVFLVPFGVYYWPMPSHHWAVAIFQLGAMVALLSGIRNDTRTVLKGCLSGVLTGLACFSLQDQGIYFLLMICAFFFPFIPIRDLRRKLIIGWAAGLGGTVLLFALWLLPRVSLGDLWYQWVGFTLGRYKGLEGNQGGLLLGWEVIRSTVADPHMSLDFKASLVIAAGIIFILPFAFLLSACFACSLAWWTKEKIGLLVAAGLAFLGAAAHRWSLTYLVWAAPPLLVAVLAGMDRIPGGDSSWRKYLKNLFLISVIASSLTYSKNLMNMAFPGKAFAVHASAGSLKSGTAIEARSFQETVEAVERIVPKGVPLFCPGYIPLVNFLTQRPNPTKYTIFQDPELHTAGMAREVTALLDSLPACYVLLTPGLSRESLVRAHVLLNYRLVWQSEWAALFRNQSHD